jgi:RNA polymerase sigma-70 factor (ECF subfamily)
VALQDNDLAAAAARGDQEAFALLVERYRRYIYAIAYRIALNEDDALDITQNVFVRLVEKIGAFRGRGPFRAWLATIASREALSHLRRPARRREAATEPDALERLADHRGASRSGDVRQALDDAYRRRQVEEAMMTLSPQQRAIFALRLKEDMPPREIARQLGLPPRQVRSQLHRAIARLRQIVGDDDKPRNDKGR